MSSALASFDDTATRGGNAELTITCEQDEVVFRETVFGGHLKLRGKIRRTGPTLRGGAPVDRAVLILQCVFSLSVKKEHFTDMSD